MGKVTFEFDSVEEQDAIRDALDGHKWKLLVWDLDQKLRDTTKYGNSVITPTDGDSASELEIDIADKYRELIRELLEEYNLKLD